MALKFDASHFDKRSASLLNRRLKEIERLIDEALDQIARSSAGKVIDPEKAFRLEDFPVINRKIKNILEGLGKELISSIEDGDREQWLVSAEKNDSLVDSLVKGTSIPKETIEAWKQPNLDALQAFQQRKTDGMNLSKRVWNITEQVQRDLEMALDIGLGSGLSAADLSREVRKYLKYPDKLFRRVRDKNGNLRLSKNAAAFHPGRGVYRSSYKNALRLAATENNMAYRASDHERWQQLNFVVGIRIVISNNHTCLGSDGKRHDFTDICDELSAPPGSTNTSGRGCYPKDFKFTGWHPYCRCHAESILKTKEEMEADNAKIMAGEDVSDTSVNTVSDVPKEFKDWVKNNKERIGTATSMPYFISDNNKYIDSILRNATESELKMEMTSKWPAFGKSAKAKTKASQNKLNDWVDNLYEIDDATSQIFRHKYVGKDWGVLVDDFLSTKMTQKEMDAPGDDDPIELYILKNGKKATIPVYDLRPTQPWIGEPMQWIPWKDSEQKSPIPLIHIAGTNRYYVANGHHRAIQRILWGHDTVDAIVIEAPNSLIKKLSSDDKFDKIAKKYGVKSREVKTSLGKRRTVR